MAFFFIRFRNLAISHSVNRIQGAWMLPGLASVGGGLRSERALLVDMPATALCTFVPIVPGGLGGRGIFGTLVLCAFGALGTFIPAGLIDLLRDGAPTRDVGIGIGEGGTDSQSESVVGGGESGLGGGNTSPGTVTFRFRYRCRGPEPGVRLEAAAARAPSSRRVIRGGGVPSMSPFLPGLMRFACGELSCGTGVGSREGGFGRACSFDIILVSRL